MKAELVKSEDIEIQVGRALGGDFMKVVHNGTEPAFNFPRHRIRNRRITFLLFMTHPLSALPIPSR